MPPTRHLEGVSERDPTQFPGLPRLAFLKASKPVDDQCDISQQLRRRRKAHGGFTASNSPGNMGGREFRPRRHGRLQAISGADNVTHDSALKPFAL
jgi:hypothetical protein